MNITQNYLTRNDCYNSGRRITPIGIQIHSIGTAQNDASALASYWNQPGLDTCVHYAVDAAEAGKVLQFLPENYRSWADAGYGNNNLITIEMMESDGMRYAGGANFIISNQSQFEADIKRSYRSCVQLCISICRRYGWNPRTELPSGLHLISSHDEGRLAGLSSSHVDPTHIWSRLGLTMDGFRGEVAAGLGSGSSEPEEPEQPAPPETGRYYRIRTSWGDPASQIGAYQNLDNAIRAWQEGYYVYDWNGKVVYPESTEQPFRVRVTASALNIRSGAGTDSPVTGVITDQGVYTIVDERDTAQGDWGELSSGAGWISLNYTERV